MAKTKQGYEEYLNNLYGEMPFEEVVEQFAYLTNKSRGKYCSEYTLISKIRMGQMGTLLHRLDTISFYNGYNEWKKQ